MAALYPPQPAVAATKATIAVLPFEIAEVVRSGAQFETEVLVDVFKRVLTQSRKFDVVDRSKLQRVRREQRFGGSGLVTSNRAAANLKGAQFLVVGTVQDYSVGPVQEMAYGSGYYRPVRISVEVEVIDSSTGQVVAARKAEGVERNRESSPSVAAGIPRKGLEEAAESCANDARLAILDAAYPIKILDVSGDTVHLNRGEGGGLEVGTQLRCFAAGKTLVDPDTKEVLGTSESFAGRIRITEVMAKLSSARIEDGSPSTGNACRAELDDEATGTHRDPPPRGPIYSY